jgi:hypothetical protein
MNCLEYRRKVMEDNTSTSAMREHASECAVCAAFMGKARAMDHQIAAALQVPTPETLAARIVFRQQMAESNDVEFEALLGKALHVDVPAGLESRILAHVLSEAEAEPTTKASANVIVFPRRQTVVRFALAASIALGVAVSALVGLGTTQATLATEVVEHVTSEPWLMEGNETVTRGDLEPILRTVGVDLDDMPGRVTKAFPCPSRPELSLHMVMDGAHGKLTVLVMPGENLAEPLRASSGDWHGLVVPVRHGSMAVIGDAREDLQAHAEHVRKLLRWRL